MIQFKLCQQKSHDHVISQPRLSFIQQNGVPKTMIDILDHRHKVAPLSIGGVGTRKSGGGRPQPGGRLLNRRQTQDQAGLGQLGNRNVGDIGDLLVTRPIQRVQSAQANSPTQNPFDSDAHELPELINPLPLINFRMRNMRF